MTTNDGAIEEHLKQLEQRLLQPGIRKSPAELDALLADEFVEFTSTGEICSKAQIVEALRKAQPAQMALANFKAILLAPDIALATFLYSRESTADRPGARSIRSSIWKRINGRWRMVFHQGTLCGGK